jgi:hypothetical protein
MRILVPAGTVTLFLLCAAAADADERAGDPALSNPSSKFGPAIVTAATSATVETNELRIRNSPFFEL